MKLVTIVGARPQFIKAAPVSKLLRELKHHEIILHTGQHYDYAMSQIFFDQLGIPEPDVNINVGSGTHGCQTGKMLMRIEKIILEEKPDWVLVYGDTNSTLAGALAACKLRFPLAHVEAGMRSFNREMPEEHNRVLTDHCSDILFCPTQKAVENLTNEGIKKGIHFVGDTMYDALLKFVDVARKRSNILHRLGLRPKEYLLATLHRPYNVDAPENLTNVLSAFIKLDMQLIFPVHPRTRKRITQFANRSIADFESSKVNIIEPVSYLDMLILEENAKVILTDSGGMQKEAYFLGVPCITLRSETEWIETVEAGWNQLAGTDPNRIIEAMNKINCLHDKERTTSLFGQGNAAVHIAQILNDQVND